MKKNAISIVVGAFALGACFKLIRNNKKRKERTYTKLFEKKFEEIKKGYKFGGFTCESWDGNGDKKDTNAFCFSLNKNKIYNWKKGKSSIFASPESGPVFGNCIFELKDQFLEMGGLCSEDYFYDNQESQCEVNGEEEQFEVEEVEVFSVLFS